MDRHVLSIDIETYSSVDIKKAGLYKYVESPDFQILLFAYSIDNGPVELVDFTEGQRLPDGILQMLLNPAVIKQAYNASFEWYCLSKWLGLMSYARDGWLAQWHCTMLHSLYCGLPIGLGVTGAALGIPEDKRKLTTGKALIKYFCTPCAPSKANGGRQRNLPHHDPGKWQLFKEYNRQDVVAEMDIANRLAAFPVPEVIQQQWELDIRINTRGVAVDLDLISGALQCHAQITETLTGEATGISDLANPNSVAQLTAWLREETGKDIANLTKGTVTNLLDGTLESNNARRMLEIRRELGKTSVKKYTAMETAVCDDGRVRGLLQFYGANRTGRWAGRLVQVQNLPRTYLPMLPFARELVKTKQLDILRLVYGGIPDTLSQLIRTAFIAAPGKAFVDADFSAIEARVISWLAGEQWRMDVFRTHGKIYEASASQMFGVPLETITKDGPNYALRQKGKVAELALGYQGAAGALINMGALDMGIPEGDLPDIVSRWRQTNRRICDLWYALEAAAIDTIKTGRPVGLYGLLFARELDVAHRLDYMTIQLPCGRKLFYAQPTIGVNNWGKDSILYWGMDQNTKKWCQLETYGGKLTENIVQAIARDCLSENLDRVEQAGYPVVFHVHDEIVIETEAAGADVTLTAVCEIMSRPIPWAPGLPLKAEGWVDGFFKKD